MAQDLTRLVAGNHLWFARGGTTVDSVGPLSATVGPPDSNPETNWTSMGCIESMVVNRDISYWEPKCPSPGGYVDAERVTLSKSITYSFTLNQISNVFFQLLMNTSGPVPDGDASGAFEPNDAQGVMEAWWKIQTYDQNDAIKLKLDIWGAATIPDSANFNQDGTVWNLDIKQLESANNAGSIHGNTFTAPA